MNLPLPRGPGAAPRLVPLRAWLDGLADGPPRVLVGATGHLILSAEEETAATQGLLARALPELSGVADNAEVVVVTGMAPGADLLVDEVTPAWLRRNGKAVRRVGLLPVPPEVLWADWLERASREDPARIANMRRRFDHAIGTADALVQLWPAPEPDWTSLEARQLQYRALGAALAEQCNLLIAIVRAGHAGKPGGSLDVVEWRESPEAIPSALRTGPRRHPSGWSRPDRLIVVDPSAEAGSAATLKSAIDSVRTALRKGNYLLAYDRVVKAQRFDSDSPELEYLHVLSLANAGSTQAALRRFEERKDRLPARDEDWLALEGRLHKDLAAAAGAHAPQHYRRAADGYLAAFRKTGGYYTAINAATTARLAGDIEQGTELARTTLELVAAQEPGGEMDRYYLAATEAEASLLLGDIPRAQSALERADRLIVDDVNARSRTRQQLRLICRALEIDKNILRALRMPPVVYVSPLATRDATVTTGQSSMVYAGITEPRELERAEAHAQSGAQLHLVLAAPRETMLRHWREVHGPDWSRRLADLVERASEYSVARGFMPEEDEWCDRYVDAMALGLSRLAAKRLGGDWCCPGVDDPNAPESAALELSKQSARTRVGDALFDRRFAGLIFADFAGFSRLRDPDLPVFWARFMRAIAACLDAHRDGILLQHTWGDALHVVTDTASTAAAIACDVRDRVEKQRSSLPPALARLELRLAAHFAPVFAGPNPVEDERTYFGTPLSMTARIEPVTPPGMIFVTEALAAQISLESPADFFLEYAGEVSLAKAYARSRLFSLRRRRSRRKVER